MIFIDSSIHRRAWNLQNLFKYLAMGAVGWAYFSRPALAHSGHGWLSLFSGLAHPWSGLDHLLVALAVGVWAASSTRGADLKIPFAFICGMIGGMVMGQYGTILPFQRQGIVLALMLPGVYLLSGARSGGRLGVLMVAIFGIFHGQAHGAEVSLRGLNVPVFSGLVLSTALLHGLGLVAALWIRKTWAEERATWVLRCFGAFLVGAVFVL